MEILHHKRGNTTILHTLNLHFLLCTKHFKKVFILWTIDRQIWIKYFIIRIFYINDLSLKMHVFFHSAPYKAILRMQAQIELLLGIAYMLQEQVSE